MNPEEMAQRFHEAYERLAPSFGYETRRESAVPWAEVPESNRRLMAATVAEAVGPLLAEVERLRGVVGLLREARAWWPRDPHSPHVPRMNPAAPFLEAIDTALAALELKP